VLSRARDDLEGRLNSAAAGVASRAHVWRDACRWARVQSAARTLAGLVITAALLCSRGALAQNMREVPLGGRTATMGGAGVAAGMDAAMPLLNPAGLAATPHDMLSVSGDVYSGTWMNIPRYFRPNGVNTTKFGTVTNVSQEDYSLNEFDSTPSGLAYFLHLGPKDDPTRHTLGISVTVQTFLLFNEGGTFDADTTTGHVREDVIVAANQFQQYIAGPSYAWRVNDRLRFGASVFFTYGRGIEDTHDNTAFGQIVNGVLQPSFDNMRNRLDATSLGLTGVLGVQARVAPRFWLGAAVEAPGIPIYGWGDVFANEDASGVDPTKGQLAAHQDVHVSFKDFQIRRPFRASLGLAYESPKSFAIAADAHMMAPQSKLIHSSYTGDALTFVTGQPLSQTSSSSELSVDSRLTFNGSIGAEVFITDSLAIRGGVMTDRDIVADTGASGQKNSRLDWYMATLGLGQYEGIFETTYGVGARYGLGTRYVPDHFNSGAPVGVDYDGWGVMIILSGSVKTDGAKDDDAKPDAKPDANVKPDTSVKPDAKPSPSPPATPSSTAH
jgi:hypothetical protein